MIERIVISLALMALLVVAYSAVRRWHLRRASLSADRSEQPALLYFRSDTCAPCVTQARFLQQLPDQVARQIKIEKIDAEKDRETAARFGVFTLPTILLVDRQGSVRHVNYGLTDARKLARQLESVL